MKIMNDKFNTKILILLLLFSRLSLSQDYDGILSEDVYIKLGVMMCTRNCPTYELTIHGDGKLEYEGINGVKKISLFNKTIPAKKMASLMSNIINTQYFTRSDESHNCVTSISFVGVYEESSICLTSSHGPIINFDIKFGDMHRKVHLSNHFSNDYSDLKQDIIKIAGIKRWVKQR